MFEILLSVGPFITPRTNMAKESLKILIAGAGVAGPALAYWLSRIPTRTPLEITILERSAAPRITGQSIDIRGPAVEVMRRMGLEDAVRKCCTPERGLQRVTESGRVVATLGTTGDAGHQAFTSEFEILRADLVRLCSEAAEHRPGVKFLFGNYISAISQAGADGTDRVRVEFTNSTLPAGEYDLVVGADGLMSHTRPHVTGRPAKDDLRDLGAYVAYFTIPRGGQDSDSLARWWNLPGARSVMARPSSAGTGVYLYVVRPDAALGAALRQDAAAQKRVLAAAFEDGGPETQRVLAGMHAAGDFYFVQIAQVRAPRWCAGRIALVGDAAYCPCPLTGMGTSLALYGAYVLAGELSLALCTGGDGDVPAALARYEQTLRPYVQKVQKIAPGMPWIVHPTSQLGISILNFLFWLLIKSRVLSLFSATPGEDQSVTDYAWT
jgi:2-polyprenyl-6-methoxyphenol hydroxylase-like FAD-dependent oxidoreductase